MASFENQAAWQTEAKARPLNVGPGPVPNPSEDEVVIKVAYAAVNPVDYMVRSPIGNMCASHIDFVVSIRSHDGILISSYLWNRCCGNHCPAWLQCH